MRDAHDGHHPRPAGHDRADLGGNDLIGTAGNNHIYAYGGDDRIEGGGGHDFLDAGAGDGNSVWGGAGDGVLRTEGKGGFFDGGSGNDVMIVDYLGPEDDVFNLAAGTARIDGRPRFTIANFESLYPTGGDDWIGGTSDSSVGIEGLAGSNHADTLRLSNVGGQLKGGAGDDLLRGGARGDVIDGGQGWDQLWGGGGADRFVFSATSHSSPAADWIRDFELGEGDRIEVSRIDANPNYPGDQVFHKIVWAGSGSPSYSTDFSTGAIGVSRSGGDTYLHFNTVDQSSTATQHDPAEMIVRLTGYHDITLDSFIL